MTDSQAPQTPGGDAASPRLFPAPVEPKAPAEPPMGFLDQLLGLFTNPAEVFRRLRAAPSWGAALGAILAVALLANLAWSRKVDLVGVARNNMETVEQVFHTAVPADKKEQALDQAASQGKPYVRSAAGVLVVMPIIMLMAAGIFFALAKLGGRDEEVGFRHAWAASVVHGLATFPLVLLSALMALVKDVGAASNPLALSPSNPLYWVKPESLLARGFLSMLEPFSLFSLVVLFLAAKHTLRLRPWAVVLLVAIFAFFTLTGRFFSGIF